MIWPQFPTFCFSLNRSISYKLTMFCCVYLNAVEWKKFFKILPIYLQVFIAKLRISFGSLTKKKQYHILYTIGPQYNKLGILQIFGYNELFKWYRSISNVSHVFSNACNELQKQTVYILRTEVPKLFFRSH